MNVFSPDAVSTINRAYVAACDILARQDRSYLRAQLAAHMMKLAKTGVTDQDRLRELSLAAVLDPTMPVGAVAVTHRDHHVDRS